MVQFPSYYYQQSAVLPIQGEGDALQLLLITSRTKKRWVIPKGVVDEGLTPKESAAKEALEEAGIEGDILPEQIGVYEYPKWGGTCQVKVFVMRVQTIHEQWLESFRERVWLTCTEASQRVREEKLQEIIRQLPSFLATSA